MVFRLQGRDSWAGDWTWSVRAIDAEKSEAATNRQNLTCYG